jgi:hypothetical protein
MGAVDTHNPDAPAWMRCWDRWAETVIDAFNAALAAEAAARDAKRAAA